MVGDVEELEGMDASEIHVKRLNAKEVLTPMNGEKSYSQSHKTFWRRSGIAQTEEKKKEWNT